MRNIIAVGAIAAVALTNFTNLNQIEIGKGIVSLTNDLGNFMQGVGVCFVFLIVLAVVIGVYQNPTKYK